MLFRLCLLAALFVYGRVCSGEPKISGSGLRFGGSPRLTASNWAYFVYRVENPDPEETTVLLSLRADRDSRAVFEKQLRLAGESCVSGRELVTAASSDNYTLSLFRDSVRLARTSVPSRHSDPVMHTQLFFVNDDEDFGGSGDLARSDLLNERVSVTSVGARNAPHHWAGYGDSRAVVLFRPRMADLTAMQFAALDEYVHRGGTLVFISPRGTLAALGTPLCDLLPVLPVRVRHVEELPALDAWGAAFHSNLPRRTRGARQVLATWEGIDFLEGVSAGDGVTTLSSGDFPVVRWCRRGLGRVGVVSVNPFSPLMKDSYCMYALWDHILAWSQAPFSLRRHENSRILPSVLAHLTGFEIPSVGTITRVLVTYFVVLLVVLLGGFALRRHASAWVLASVVGLAFTVGIFAAAFRQNSDRPARSATVVDFSMPTGARQSGHAVLSLFSKGDCRLDIVEGSPDGLLRPLPSAARGKRKAPLSVPLVLRSGGDRVSARSMRVQALKPRSLANLYVCDPLPVAESARLVLGPENVSFADAVLPEWIGKGSSRVFLISAGDASPVSVRKGACAGLVSGGGRIRLDTFTSDLLGMLRSGCFPSPSLAVVSPWREQRHSLSVDVPGFDQHGYSVFFLPVGVSMGDGPVTVPSAFIRVCGAGAYGRMFFSSGEWRRHIARQPAQIIPLEAILPPYLADLSLDSLEVVVDAGNPGGNLEFSVGLGLPGSDYSAIDLANEGPALWGRAVKAVRVEGTHHHFSDLSGHSLLDRTSGRLLLLLRVSQKRLLTDPAEGERTNTWRMVDFRVQAGGTLATGSEGRRF